MALPLNRTIRQKNGKMTVFLKVKFSGVNASKIDDFDWKIGYYPDPRTKILNFGFTV